MATQTVKLSIDNHIAWLKFSRPEFMNSYNWQMSEELPHMLNEIAQNSTVRVLILEGEGPCFMAGGDVNLLKRAVDEDIEFIKTAITALNNTIKSLIEMKPIVIAKPHGAVAGAGLSIMLASDLVICAENTVFNTAYINLGLSPDGGLSYTLPKVVGNKKALEWLLLSERFDEKTALEYGLINKIVSFDELHAETLKWAEKLCRGPKEAMSRVKSLVNQSWQNNMASHLEMEKEFFSQCTKEKNFSIGVEAFLQREKRSLTMNEIISLKGKTVFITGATRGIGRAIALKCAEHGANIVVTGKTDSPHPKLPGTIYTVAEEVQKAGGKALPFKLDVRDDQNILAAVEAVVNTFGGIDILINNASAINLTPTLDTPVKKFELLMKANVGGTFLCSQACIPYLKKSTNAHILNLSPPITLSKIWFKPHCAYTISKFAMSMCTLGMSEEFKDDGVAVNSLWPQTTIATAAIEFNFPKEMIQACRTANIVADAAYIILSKRSTEFTGNFCIDEDVLRGQGIKNLNHYAVAQGSSLQRDLFL